MGLHIEVIEITTWCGDLAVIFSIEGNEDYHLEWLNINTYCMCYEVEREASHLKAYSTLQDYNMGDIFDELDKLIFKVLLH